MSESDSFSPRRLKIIVISDYACIFSYIANKTLHDAIDACRDLPILFDVEFRPFSLMCQSSPNASIGTSRNAYLLKKLGKEQAEAKWKVAFDMAQNTGLKIARDGIICRTTQAHRLSVKAYQVGGQTMQKQLNSLVFDEYFAEGKDISREDFLVDVAVKIGLMNEERAAEFLKSTEALDCVEKMIQAARANGVNGVPFIIIDGKWALNGVQPMDFYIQMFRKLAQSHIASCKDPIVAPALFAQ